MEKLNFGQSHKATQQATGGSGILTQVSFRFKLIPEWLSYGMYEEVRCLVGEEVFKLHRNKPNH